jgi:hypothetical protein
VESTDDQRASECRPNRGAQPDRNSERQQPVPLLDCIDMVLEPSDPVMRPIYVALHTLIPPVLHVTPLLIFAAVYAAIDSSRYAT